MRRTSSSSRGRLRPVHHQADQGLPRGVGADVDVPQEAPACPLVVGGDIQVRQIPLHRPGGGSGLGALEAAVGGGDHLVAPGPVEPGPAVGAHGELTLVPVAVHSLAAQDRLHGYVRPAHPAQGVLHPLPLGGQLLLIGDVAEVAAAAGGVVGAVWFPAGGSGLQHPLHPAKGHVLQDLQDADLAPLPTDSPVDEHHPALHPGHAQPLGGVALNGDLPYVVLPQLLHWILPPRYTSFSLKRKGSKETFYSETTFRWDLLETEMKNKRTHKQNGVLR